MELARVSYLLAESHPHVWTTLLLLPSLVSGINITAWQGASLFTAAEVFFYKAE